MLHAVDQNDLIVCEDLIDDAIVAAPRRPKAVEFTAQWLAEPTRVAGDRFEDGLQGSVPYLLGEPVEMTETLSRDYESKFVDVHGSKMHYVDVGEGDPILFLHGNPTSSYLWRNIIPHPSGQGRCIAPDLIGMGKSDHPKTPYRYDDQYRYVSGFVDALGIGSNLTLVIHDWGSGLGFRWAYEHEESVRGIAFMEAMLTSLTWEIMPANYRMGFRICARRASDG